MPDTIFALSSGAPPAAIAVLRISGPAAFDAIKALAARLPLPRKASLRQLIDPINDNLLDEALTLIFPGPNSATGEDLAELHLHGGRAVVRAVETALDRMPGLRQALPGEFTRRAFANGRIDLNEAEGLADLLSAETEWQRRSAVAMAGGVFSKKVDNWREAILQISAQTEAIIDFSDEDDVDEKSYYYISNRCFEICQAISTHLAFPIADRLRNGLRVVLAGPPNSGKSTLLNALVARDAAIVSDIPGTTRDLIDVPVSFDGIPFIFTDTAGLRDDSNDIIEAIGIRKTQKAIADADIIFWLGPEGEGPANSRLIEIEAKIDDPNHLSKSDKSLKLSAITGDGIADLIALLVDKSQNMLPPLDGFALSQRQHAMLVQTASCLDRAAKEGDILIIAEELRQARIALDTLIGRAGTVDMLDTLFGRFCIGK
ncbi:MAG: tRNA uridine-5-carboxymethylaminomethyl(34) synthesis GTPase MnmE [Sphingorhabdus sp.]